MKQGLHILFSILKVFSFILVPFVSILIVFFCLCFVWYIKFHYVDGMKLQPSGQVKPLKRSLFLKLFVDLPKRYVKDIYSREEGFFVPRGIHMFCGEQGAGKTIAAVEMMLRLHKQYPQSKLITNFDVVGEDDQLTEWQQLLTYTNGHKGVIVGIDEIQNWFMSGRNQLPEGMLEVATQNRKNNRILCCTAQVFTRVNKALREQVTYVYSPFTFFGSFTVVIKRKPQFDSEGNVLGYKYKGMYSFVHTDELRNAYDTYKVIHTLAQEGFKESPMQVVNYVSASSGRRKR